MKKNNDNNQKSGSVFMYWLLMLTLIFLAVNVVFAVSFIKLSNNFKSLKTTNETQNKEYETEISNLKQKVTLLAEYVSNENELKSIEEEKKNPKGIPVSGQAEIISDPKEDAQNTESEENGKANGESGSFENNLMNPYTLEISVNRGSKVIATGNGIVSEIAEDDIYGYIVTVDHENGYETIYRYSEEPKIKEGDEVLKGQMIYEVTNNKGILAYHILYENTYINPFDMIEISG